MFKERLRAALIERNMKPIELAEKLGVTRGTISGYLSGVAMPKAARLREIARILNVSQGWLLGQDVPMDYDPDLFDNMETMWDNIMKNGDLRLFVEEASKADDVTIRSLYELLKRLNEGKNETT